MKKREKQATKAMALDIEPRGLVRMDWAGDRLNGDTRRSKRLANVAAAFFRAARADGVYMRRASREAGAEYARSLAWRPALRARVAQLAATSTTAGVAVGALRRRLARAGAASMVAGDPVRRFVAVYLGQPYPYASEPASTPVVFMQGSALGKTTEAVAMGVDVQDGRTLVHTSAPINEEFDRWQWFVDRSSWSVPLSTVCGGGCAAACPPDAARPGVACAQQVDPPVGTPYVSSPRGNSAPALAPVAGRADWLNPVVGG